MNEMLGKRVLNRIKYGHLRNNVILIYTMGKVGSSTFYESLSKIPNVAVFHVHFLSDDWMTNVRPGQFQASNIKNAKFVRNYLKDNEVSKLKIISLVRDPVTMMVSGLFQNWDRYFDQKPTDVPIDDIAQFLEQMDYSYPLEWFDNEFESFTGFDIYHHPFDRERGMSLYRNSESDILLLTLESLDKNFSESVRRLLSVKMQQQKANIRAQKPENEVYKKVKATLKLPDEKLNSIYNSKFVRHFYTDESITQFKNRWIR